MTPGELIDNAKKLFDFLPQTAGYRFAYDQNRKKLDGYIRELYALGYEVYEQVGDSRSLVITQKGKAV